MNANDILILYLVLPIAGIFLSSLGVMWKQISNYIINGIFVALLVVNTIVSGLISLRVYDETTISATFIQGISVDWLSAVLLLIASIMFLLAGLFSLYYMDMDTIAQYATLIFAMQAGLQLILTTTHLFSLFIFWELMVISGYILVAFEKEAPSLEAGFKYLIISSIGSLSILFGLGILSGLVPSLYFEDIIANPPASSALTSLSLVFLVLGFGVTGGILAFNQWLPDAHPAAPAPVSALLSGVIVKAGIYGIYRVTHMIVPGLDPSASGVKIVLILAILTMTEGNLMVFAQLQRKDTIDLKRILAYSTTTHLGYLLITTVLTSDLGKIAMVLHIINHAIAKGLLFFISGYIIHEYGTKDILKLKEMGIGSKDKVLAVLMFVPLMSLGGLPLTGGFVSKLLILVSLYQESTATPAETTFLFVIMFLAIVNSALAFGGYLWVIKELIFSESTIEVPEVGRHPMVKLLLSTMVVSIILLGIFPYVFINPLESIL